MNPDNIYSIQFDFQGFDDDEIENYITFNDEGQLQQPVNDANNFQTGSQLFQSKTKNSRGKAMQWVLKSNFPSNESFEESDFFSKINSGFLKLHKSAQTKKFSSIKTYWCEFSSKRSGYDCPFKARVEVNYDGSINYLENEEEHCHSLMLGAKRKYKSWSAGEEDKMKSLLNLDITSRNLKKAIEHKENRFPSGFSFYNKVKRLKSSIGMSQTLVTKQELHDFFMSESVVPDDQEQIFIPDFYFDNNGEQFEFGALFTTGFFVETYLKSKKPWCLNLDFTYQLSTDEFVVLFFGATDELGFYHPFGWGLVNHENTRSVIFFLEWIKREAAVAPRYIMADGAPQISLAIEKVFPLSTDSF